MVSNLLTNYKKLVSYLEDTNYQIDPEEFYWSNLLLMNELINFLATTRMKPIIFQTLKCGQIGLDYRKIIPERVIERLYKLGFHHLRPYSLEIDEGFAIELDLYRSDVVNYLITHGVQFEPNPKAFSQQIINLVANWIDSKWTETQIPVVSFNCSVDFDIHSEKHKSYTSTIKMNADVFLTSYLLILHFKE
jgi:hypothetical protein